jgi:hypothetical protein
MQELYIHGGQNDNYERSVACIEKYLRIEVSSSQMERVSQTYGKLLDSDCSYLSTEHSVLEAQIETFELNLVDSEHVYCMVDGSMIPTREGEEKNDWKEVKLGRIFGSAGVEVVDKHHNNIKHSAYVADLGNSIDFCKKMDVALLRLENEVKRKLIFINDGGQWIWNWVSTNYPESVQILDYYHALEKLSACGKLIFSDPLVFSNWLDRQKERLFLDQVGDIALELVTIIASTTNVSKAGEIQKTLNYIQKHKQRMLYKTFFEKGYLIGSGPIESAHRVVLQKRLKQSGQRWTKDGAQNIINLRVVSQANQWDKVIETIKYNEILTYNYAA